MPGRKETPGAGLGQILELEPDPEIEVDEPTPISCSKCGATLIRCPVCRGSTYEELVPIAGGGGNEKYGEYRWKICDYCDGTGHTSIAKAERWRLRRLAQSPSE